MLCGVGLEAMRECLPAALPLPFPLPPLATDFDFADLFDGEPLAVRFFAVVFVVVAEEAAFFFAGVVCPAKNPGTAKARINPCIATNRNRLQILKRTSLPGQAHLQL
jgi:hypothetical protein